GYMSPEQARGKAVDKRADIWAFGVVLYELLMGKRLFQGEDVSHTMAAVIMQEPNLDAVPVQVRKLLQRCLVKDPKRRLRDIGESMPLLGEGEEPPTASPDRRRWLWPSVAGAALLTAASLAAVDWLREPPKPGMVALTIDAPAGQRIGEARVSPDG